MWKRISGSRLNCLLALICSRRVSACKPATKKFETKVFGIFWILGVFYIFIIIRFFLGTQSFIHNILKMECKKSTLEQAIPFIQIEEESGKFVVSTEAMSILE